MKTILIKFIFLCFLIISSIDVLAKEDKQISFITVNGTSNLDAKIKSHNIAYMNGFKIVSKKTIKSGNTWTVIAKVVQIR